MTILRTYERNAEEMISLLEQVLELAEEMRESERTEPELAGARIFYPKLTARLIGAYRQRLEDFRARLEPVRVAVGASETT